jgi:type 1 glutamine amidotransferase
MKRLLPLVFVACFCRMSAIAGEPFMALVIAEQGGQHEGFNKAAMKWLNENAGEWNCTFVLKHSTDSIDEAFLAKFKLVIQLDYPPYSWTKAAEKAFVRYIDEGRGGWIGFHHAALLGEFDGYPLWRWFSDFMGGIRFKNYIASKADGVLHVEVPEHPVMQGVSSSFTVPDEEWYTFDRSPRPNVQTLATVDEASYRPASDVRMGDHPAVWTNPHKAARNVYFLMGHSETLFNVKDFKTMFANAVRWTAGSAANRGYPADYAGAPRFKALIYFSEHAEKAHVTFARQGTEFFRRLAFGNGFTLETATSFDQYPYEKLKEYDVIVMLNASPADKAEREAFQQYMENGGGWVGFHAAAYNDRNTRWQWFVDFLGGGVFYCNNWPPQPAKLTVDNAEHPVTRNLPESFIAPESEWYQWNPSPRENPDVETLLSLSPDNYPIGIKDVVKFGDFPVVWTNRKYRMIYLNMGHGDDEFTDATQKLLFINAFRWVVSQNRTGDPFKN